MKKAISLVIIILVLIQNPQSILIGATNKNTVEYISYSTKASKIKLSREMKKNISEVKQLRDKLFGLDYKYSVITQERLRQIETPKTIDLNGLEKSQYETNDEYSLRIASAEQQNASTLKKFNTERASVLNNIKYEKAKEHNSIYGQIAALTTKEYTLNNVNISLGQYNADNQYFDTSMPQFPYLNLKIPVDISTAKEFKASFGKEYVAIAEINEVGDILLKSIVFVNADRNYYGDLELSNYFLWEVVGRYSLNGIELSEYAKYYPSGSGSYLIIDNRHESLVFRPDVGLSILDIPSHLELGEVKYSDDNELWATVLYHCYCEKCVNRSRTNMDRTHERHLFVYNTYSNEIQSLNHPPSYGYIFFRGDEARFQRYVPGTVYNQSGSQYLEFNEKNNTVEIFKSDLTEALNKITNIASQPYMFSKTDRYITTRNNLYEVKSGQKILAFQEDYRPIYFSNKDSYVITNNGYNSYKVYALGGNILTTYIKSARTVAFSSDEKYLAVATRMKSVEIVDQVTHVAFKKFPTNGKVRYVSFIENDNAILIVDDMINIYERSEYVPNKPTLVSSERALLAPKLDLIAAFVDPNGNGYLEAEEQARFNVSIKNSGEGDALGVMLEASLNLDDPNIDYLKRVYVGNISKGEEKKVPIQISASSKVRVNQLAMAFSAKESNGFSPDPIEILFESKPLILPDLRLVDYGLTTAIDDNIIRPGVRTDIQVRIQNQGQGFADDIYFKIILPSNLFFDPGSQTEYQDIQLGPGKYKDLEFSFTCNNNVGAKVELKIDYKEAHTQGSLPLSLDVDKAQQSIKQFTVKRSKIASVEINDVSTISVDIEDDIPKAKTINKKAIGVVFGIEQYKDISDVTFATRDAKWIYKYFQDVLGIPKSRIYFRTNSDVSKAEFDKVLLSDGWLDKRVEAGETEVYFYYAGHGAPDIKQNKAYLIPYDGDPNYASQTGIKLDDIYSRLNALDAKSVTVFWDACFSGANRNNEMLLADARPVFIEVEEDVAGGITVFSAASARQISSAWPEKKHGLFSYFLMKGMQGDADINKDKQITIGELGEYIKENVPEMAGMLDREQTPELKSMNPEQVLIQF